MSRLHFCVKARVSSRHRCSSGCEIEPAYYLNCAIKQWHHDYLLYLSFTAGGHNHDWKLPLSCAWLHNNANRTQALVHT